MLIEIVLLLIVGLTLIFLFKIIKSVFILILNSVIGLFALIGFNHLFSSDITINFWSVIITAIGGLIGFAVVVAVHFLGIAF